MTLSFPGIAPDDPLKPLLDGMAERDAVMNRNVAALTDAIRGVSVLPPNGMVELIQAAANGADRRTVELTRSHNRRALLTYGSVLVAGALMASGLGFWRGWVAGRASVHNTDQHLSAAFQDGPNAAAAWALLMEQNDLPRALAMCVGPRAYVDQAGRKVCLLPLYVEAPRRGAPTEAQR